MPDLLDPTASVVGTDPNSEFWDFLPPPQPAAAPVASTSTTPDPSSSFWDFLPPPDPSIPPPSTYPTPPVVTAPAALPYRELAEVPQEQKLAQSIDNWRTIHAQFGGSGANPDDILYWMERVPIAGAAGKAFDLTMIHRAVKSIEAGKGSDDDFSRIGQFVATEEEKAKRKGFGQQVLDTGSYLPGFVLEFLMSGGVGKIGLEAAKRGAVKVGGEVVEQALTKAAAKAAEKSATGLALRGAGTAGFEAVRAAAMPQRVLESAARERLEGMEFSRDAEGNMKVGIREGSDDVVKSLGKGFADTWIETLTERMGGVTIGAARKAVGWTAGKTLGRTEAGARLADWAARKWIAARPGRTPEAFRAALKEMGQDGLIGELVEERLGEVARGATGLNEDFGATGGLVAGDREAALRQLAVEAVAFSVPGGTASALSGFPEARNVARFVGATPGPRETKPAAAETIGPEAETPSLAGGPAVDSGGTGNSATVPPVPAAPQFVEAQEIGPEQLWTADQRTANAGKYLSEDGSEENESASLAYADRVKTAIDRGQRVTWEATGIDGESISLNVNLDEHGNVRVIEENGSEFKKVRPERIFKEVGGKGQARFVIHPPAETAAPAGGLPQPAAKPAPQPVSQPVAPPDVGGPVSGQEMQDLFPGAVIQPTAEGDGYWVNLPSGEAAEVRFVEDITPETQQAIDKAAASRGMTPEEVQKQRMIGAFRMRSGDIDANAQGLIRIHKRLGTKTTVMHEGIHWARKIGLFQPNEWEHLVGKYSRPEHSPERQEEDIARGLSKDAGQADKPTVIQRIRAGIGAMFRQFGLEDPASMSAGEVTRTVKLFGTEKFWGRGRTSGTAPAAETLSPSPGQTATPSETEQPEPDRMARRREKRERRREVDEAPVAAPAGAGAAPPTAPPSTPVTPPVPAPVSGDDGLRQRLLDKMRARHGGKSVGFAGSSPPEEATSGSIPTSPPEEAKTRKPGKKKRAAPADAARTPEEQAEVDARIQRYTEQQAKGGGIDYVPKEETLSAPTPGSTAESKAQLDAAAAKFKALIDRKVFSNPTDPELLEGAVELTIAAIRHGVRSFRDFVKFVAGLIGHEKTLKIKEYLPSAWEFVAEEDEFRGQIDEPGDVADVLGEEEPSEPSYPAKRRTADVSLANAVRDWLALHDGLEVADFWKLADEAYGGTRAAGQYGPSEAYDALELGINLHIRAKSMPRGDIAKLLSRIPSQTNRSGEKDLYQQFSTPPHYAAAVAELADLRPDDIVLEPSAGTGSLVTPALSVGSNAIRVFANERSARRAALLEELGVEKVFREDAEQISRILPGKMPAPTVVLMNPPFSHAAERMGGKIIPGTDLAHVDQALKLLAPGGRLVAITGAPMRGEETQTFSRWYRDRRKEYNIRGNVLVGRDVYKGYGTTFPTRVLVIDKSGATPADGTVIGEAATLDALLKKLDEVKRDRPQAQKAADDGGKAVQPASAGTGRKGGASKGGGGTVPESELPVHVPTGKVASGKPSGRPAKPGLGARTGAGDASGTTRGVEGSGPGRTPDADRGTSGSGSAGTGSPAGGSDVRQPVEPFAEPAGPGPVAEKPDARDTSDDVVFTPYTPSKVRVKGAKKHPASIVESMAMATVSPPDPTYSPRIPQALIDSGALSDVQYETAVYAGQSHEQMLDLQNEEGKSLRRGMLLGDGTGVGKGRQIAAVILDNWNHGRKKSVWISISQKLHEDAKRDWASLGRDPKQLANLESSKSGEAGAIKMKEGILFTTYTTMSAKPRAKQGDAPDAKRLSRLEQIVEWLGKDFDGVIAFDEAHRMGNALASRGKRGTNKPSATALAGLKLQRMLPNARVLYVSATAATEVSNLAYAERLGLWGPGTEFTDVKDFVNEISAGGVAAMEVVARDMKAMGRYLARNISYNDGTPEGTVTFDRVEHTLTEDQTEVYDKLTEAWQIVLRNINSALKLTDGDKSPDAKSNAMSQFWGTHQRFFNQVMTAMQTPSVVKAIEKDMKDGKSVVIQLTNTFEAAQERALSKRDEEEEELEELDLTPRDALLQMVEHSFPTAQMEEYVDADGNKGWRPVTDAAGNTVHNPDALALRDKLLEELSSVRVPDSPLDMILNHFGTSNVAEVTGRGRRVVRGLEGKMEIQDRGKKASAADIKAFQDGKKRILVFSEAGGTGASYHADRTEKNQQPRVHYLLQAGWSAAKAMQGMGRTHRSNQKQAPHYVLVHTNLKGQKRFLSSIARRLSQLGALTKGQRQTTSTGLFSAADNLESHEAREALYQFFRDLHAGQIDGITIAEFEEQTGLKLVDPTNGGLKNQLPPITQFLNRLLSMKSETQNAVFSQFEERFESKVAQAKAEGTLDDGIETLRHQSVKELKSEVVYTDPAGAETRYVSLVATDPTYPVKWDDLQQGRGLGGKIPQAYVRSPRGNIYAIAPANNRTDPTTGTIISQYRMASPTAVRFEPQDKIDSKYARVPENEAKGLWEKAVEDAPKTRQTNIHLITGALLTIWTKISGRPAVVRVIMDDGSSLLGRTIPSTLLDQTLTNLGVGVDKEKQATSADVASGNAIVRLANGWTIRPSRVQGEARIEVVGPDYRHFNEMTQFGVFREKIAGKIRFFIPVGNTAVVDQVLKNRQIVSTDWVGQERFSTEADEPLPAGAKEAVFRAMEQANPGARIGSLVTARELRQRLKIPKADLDRLIVRLAREGVLSLHRHDYVASLTESEREELIHDPGELTGGGQGGHKGAFFVGAAIRQGGGERFSVDTDEGKVRSKIGQVFARLTSGERERLPDAIRPLDPKKAERIEDAYGMPRGGFYGRAAEYAKSVTAFMSRADFHVPNTREFAWARELFRHLRGLADRSTTEAVSHVRHMLEPMQSPEQLRTFSLKLLYEDLLRAFDELGQLKFGFESREEIEAELERVNKAIGGDENGPVRESLVRREQIRRRVVGKLVDDKLLPREALDNPAYFHRQVISKVLEEHARLYGAGSSIKPRKRPFQKQRSMGTGEAWDRSYDHNTNFLEAETQWLIDALTEVNKGELRRKYLEPKDRYRDFARRAKGRNFVTAVGGQEIADEIFALRAERGELLGGEDAGESDVKKRLGQIGRRLRKIDPTLPFRSRIAWGLGKLKKLGHDLEEEGVGELRSLAKNPDEAVRITARAVLKAIAGRAALIKKKAGKEFETAHSLLLEHNQGNTDTQLVAWTAGPKSVFFRALTLPERMIAQLMEKVGATVNVTAEDLRQVWARAPAIPMFLPKEVVDQIERLDKKRAQGKNWFLSAVWDTPQRYWKLFVTSGPTSIIRYTTGNLLTDIPISDPGMARHVAQAAREMWDWNQSGRSSSPAAQKAWELGVIGSGQTGGEIDTGMDADRLRTFRRFWNSRKKTASDARLVAGFLTGKSLAWASRLREDTTRYAAFLYYQEKLRANALVNYGGSNRETVKQLAREFGNDDAAAYLARNQYGDYLNTTEFANVATRILPFYKWTDTVLFRSGNMLRNAVLAKDPKTGASAAWLVGMQLVAPLAAMYMWNWLFFGDDEEKLGAHDRQTPHLILGHDENGKIIVLRNAGLLGEFLGYFGLNETAFKAFRMATERSEGKEQITMGELIGTMAKAPFNKLYQSLSPMAKGPAEVAMGETRFPDVTQPRTQPRDELLSQTVDLRDEYLWLKGKAGKSGDRSRPDYWMRMFAGLSDPRANALSSMYDARDRFLKSKGKETESPRNVSKHRKMRHALQKQDFEQFAEARQAWMADHPTDTYDGYKNFIRRLDPISSRLSDEHEKEFAEKYLTAKQRTELGVARDYGKELQLRAWAWWKRASANDSRDQRERFAGDEQKELVAHAERLARTPATMIKLTPDDRKKAMASGRKPFDILQEKKQRRTEEIEAAKTWFRERLELMKPDEVLAAAQEARKKGRISPATLMRLRGELAKMKS